MSYNLQQLAIVIPTLNRSNLLKRAISFYESFEFNGCIYVVDGSNDIEHKNNLLIINNSKLNIKYILDQKSPNEVISMAKMCDQIQEPYVTFAGDDDYQLPIGLTDCIEFLEKNKDYNICLGIRFDFNNETKTTVSCNMSHDWNYNSPSQRFLDYMMSGNSTNYGVHRLGLWKTILKLANINCRYVGTELAMCSATVILSRIHRSNRIVTLQQYDGSAWPNKQYDTGNNLPPIFQLINSPEWSDAVHKFEELIVELLMAQEGLTYEKAQHIFNLGFGHRICEMLNDQFDYKYGDEFEKLNFSFHLRGNAPRAHGVCVYLKDIEFINNHLNIQLPQQQRI